MAKVASGAAEAKDELSVDIIWEEKEGQGPGLFARSANNQKSRQVLFLFASEEPGQKSDPPSRGVGKECMLSRKEK